MNFPDGAVYQLLYIKSANVQESGRDIQDNRKSPTDK